jgi:GNAT superfamily N-acetyltransferase
MSLDVDIVRLDDCEAKSLRGDVVEIYRSTFTAPPFNDSEREVGWFDEEFGNDVELPEFRCIAARVGDRMIGFAYGFRTFEGEPWNDWYGEVLRAVGPHAEDWIRGQFAIGWFALLPAYRGRGLGRRLHDDLIASAPPGRWWLVTHDLDTPARRLYDQRGWVQIGRGPLGWGRADRLVLGLDPLGRTAAAPG